MMALLRKLFWVAVFVASTLSFLVLFENGPKDFSKNFMGQVTELRKLVEGEMTRKEAPPLP